MSAGRDWAKHRHVLHWDPDDLHSDGAIRVDACSHFKIGDRRVEPQMMGPLVFYEIPNGVALRSWFEAAGVRTVLNDGWIGYAFLNDRQYFDFRLRFPVAP